MLMATLASHALWLRHNWTEAQPRTPEQQVAQTPPDSVLFPVKKTGAQTQKPVTSSSTDLKDPENLRTGVFYDEETQSYKYGTKLGEEWLSPPFEMDESEVNSSLIHSSMREYFRKKNAEEYKKKGKEKFDFTDMHFDLGPANRIFGPGGVRIKTQGSAELKLGANTRFVDNPSLSERNRRVFSFDFDENINVSVNAKVGDKLGMDFSYNSNSTFDFDAQKLKLRYQGKEDEIIKLVEAGNVSMPSNNSLVRGASSLFGIRTDLQFGKLKLQTILAQKKSSSQSVSSKGGVQLSSYEFSADDYDENRHFFLGHFFRDKYDVNMLQLPNIVSGVVINRVEIWVTNKTGQTTNTRNIVAFADMAEQSHTANPMWSKGSLENPSNTSNNLYETISGSYPDARNISSVTPVLDGIGLVGGVDYEKLESARLLSSSEYNLNSTLGYVSLRSTMQTDQVLAVAYEYTYRGQTFQVGEFSTDHKDASEVIFVKALKNTACTPKQPNWDLMMKNVYNLGASSVQREQFRLNIKYLSDTTGVYLTYLPSPTLKDRNLLDLLGLDRLDNNNKRNPNAYFDFVEGYTISSDDGRVFFTSVEPFGDYLRKVIGNDALADKYVFDELYDSTKTVAKQIAEKDKYIIQGQYKASREDEISLGAINVPRGSVEVTAGGVKLVEGSDYSVDYYGGTVKILNRSLLDAGTPISVHLESNTEYGMQRKTLVGLNWEYDFSKNFIIGGTLLHLGEKPLTTKVTMGQEALNNTIWGLNLNYKSDNMWLTNLVDKIPLVHATEPSSINFSAEFAHLIAGKNRGAQAKASYLDDFETTSSDIDISNPKEWTISSVPSMFPESNYSNDVRYGYNRALLSWYYIDPLFTRRTSSLTPAHIKNDLEQLSDHDVREVYKTELFPNRQINTTESASQNVLNLAYYPNERGPYNLDPNVESNGHLPSPSTRWGGMMRRLQTSDFEASNIEYIEFWLMDPFIKARRDGRNVQGDLYFNLGEISEDVLKDGKKFYESGLPVDDNSSLYSETTWGRVPTQTSITYAFNTANGSRERQDVGLNGLSSADERNFPAYRNYLEAVQGRVTPEVYDSILRSPSADLYHYFRGSDYDAQQRSIKDRYKYINNPNGNSRDAESSAESYSTAYKTTPDAEDVNQDYTLNEYEKYYQYHVSIAPQDMVVGRNYIVDSRTATAPLRNGTSESVTWYLFRIPVENYERNVGGITGYNSLRFMRMFLTGFDQHVVLRFGTLNLVRGEWRTYEQSLDYGSQSGNASGSLEASAVNFEENNEKTPVNYVIPPGVSRVIDPGQRELLENNEQALALTVKNLASGDAKAVYKNTSLDLRRYKHLQMFNHANSLIGEPEVEDGQVALFIRLGSDYKSNYYEYEIPLQVTPAGQYANSNSGALAVWPEANMLDIDFTLFTNIKRNRNRQKSLGMSSYAQVYSEYDPDKPANKISVMGNPTLGDVRTIMIGVRNNSRETQSIEVWANELRLQEFSNKGGWAAQASVNIKVSDIGTVDASAHLETNGFGGLEESVLQRRDDNLLEYNVSTNVQLGKFLPDKVKLNAPLYYSYNKQKVSPQYNPLDTDMPMDDALNALETKAERDSLKAIANRVVVNKNFSLSGVRFDIRTARHAMPYDPANFTFGYAHSSTHTTGHTTVWEKHLNWKWNINYNYTTNFETVEPFKKWIKSESKWWDILKRFGFNFAPQNITFNSDINRTYYEMQERDMENLENQSIPLNWSSDFVWNRTFGLRWDFTKNIHLSFTSGTNAEIEQPYTAINKDLYPDHYTAWKDSVRRSLLHFGAPINYQQNFDFSWKLPLNLIPALDWTTVDFNYRSNYMWERGTKLEDGSKMGNTISNGREISVMSRLNMETLYNHVPFLKAVNRKFSSSSRTTSKSAKNKSKDKPQQYQSEIKLQADTSVIVVHSQHSRNIRFAAINKDGARVKLNYKVLDANRIEILTRDTNTVKVTIAPKQRKEEQRWYKALEYTTRGLMMVRNISINYTDRYNMTLPGFLPDIGDFFGQGSLSGMKPGLGFAFGFTGDSYIEKAAKRNLLLMCDTIVTPATTNRNRNLEIRATLEPFRDFKIDLTATRNTNRAKSIQYMYEGMPTTISGSFTQTTISLRTAFASIGSAKNGYRSRTFEKFVASLADFRDRVEAQYIGATYPNGMPMAGQTFNPENGTVSRYSSDVLVPAFLKAYTASGGGVGLFPKLKKLLPNWNISYAGLSKLNAMRRIFKSFTLTHAYRSIYSVGSFNTYSTFREFTGELGFLPDVETGMPIPGSMYNFSMVSLNESFSPLIGINMTLRNDISAKIEYRKSRVVTLSMTNLQINETHSKDFVIGIGYKINDLKLFQPRRTVREKRSNPFRSDDDNNSSSSRSRSTNARGFANTLNLRLDFTLRDQTTLNRDIMTLLSQATSGSHSVQVSFNADYALSRYLTVTAYYERLLTRPLLTSSSYPTTTQDFGLSFRFMLNR